MLKHNSIKKWAGVIMLTMLVGACTDDFDTINTNPNSPVDVPAANILASVMYGTARSYAGGYNYGHLACWSQMFAEVQYIGTDRYEDGSNNGYWNTPYLRLKDLQIVQEKATEDGFTNMDAIADIMAVVIYHVLTDNFGDIPYTEALMGDAAESNTTPVYDTQASV